jgi:hypothetical protein
MAKTDTILIRETKNLGNTGTYHEESIDLGAFVDPLGKSVFRVLSISVQYLGENAQPLKIYDGETAVANWQLCTQSQSDLVYASDRSLISSGSLRADGTTFSGISGHHYPSWTGQADDVNPQHWTNGMLLAVPQIYLGGKANGLGGSNEGWYTDVNLSIIIEGRVETLTTEKAVALAMSQQ